MIDPIFNYPNRLALLSQEYAYRNAYSAFELPELYGYGQVC
jgi:hypothetical protein